MRPAKHAQDRPPQLEAALAAPGLDGDLSSYRVEAVYGLASLP